MGLLKTWIQIKSPQSTFVFEICTTFFPPEKLVGGRETGGKRDEGSKYSW